MHVASFLKYADCIIECCQEKIEHNGEDSYFTSLTDAAGLVSVFDGCGGSGAKKYQRFQNKTGAYMSSRVAAGATRDWFAESFSAAEYPKEPAASLKRKIQKYLNICKEVGDEASHLKGLMTKDFPTTASIVIATGRDGRAVDVLCLSAGDSRCYMLSPEGLMQLTEDDLGNVDAMENLTADASLTNVITASRDFEIHEKRLMVPTPCILFAATDGCFGYLSTPMEFEYMLLDTLLSSGSILDWEDRLKSTLIRLSGDDFSFTGLSVGFGSFERMQQAFRPRAEHLFHAYISDLQHASPEEKVMLWRHYKGKYERYLHPSSGPANRSDAAPVSSSKDRSEPITAAPASRSRGVAAPAPSVRDRSEPITAAPASRSRPEGMTPPLPLKRSEPAPKQHVICPRCKSLVPRRHYCSSCGYDLQSEPVQVPGTQTGKAMYRPDDLD